MIKLAVSFEIIFLSSSFGTINLPTNLALNNLKSEEVAITYDDELKTPVLDGNQGYIVLKNIDDNLVKDKINKVKNNIYFENLFSFEPTKINVETIEQGIFYYKIGENKYAKGLIKGTEFTTSVSLDNLANKIKEDILSKKMVGEINSKASNVPNIEIGDSRENVYSTVEYTNLDYESLHYGEYIERLECFEGSNDKHFYSLVTHSSDIRPNSSNTNDFRTSSLVFDSSVSNNSTTILNFGPGARGTGTLISLEADPSYVIDKEGDYSFSCEYLVNEESPLIKNNSMGGPGNLNITFEYADPWTEGSDVFEYALNESYQSCFYIYESKLEDYDSFKINSDRTLSMVRDDLFPWNDKTVKFDFSTTIE